MLDKTHFQHQIFHGDFLTFSLPHSELLLYFKTMTEIVETQHGVSLGKKERERQRQRFLVNLRSLNSFQRRRRVFGNGLGFAEQEAKDLHAFTLQT